MRAGALLAVSSLLAMGLAGCSGGSTPSEASSSSSAALAAAGVQPPTWAAGDWWNYTGTNGAFSYVVTAAGGADYTMGTDSAGLAFFDARFDVSTLGAIRKSDLAGSQGQTRVAFFHWPLRDGLNWTTTWDAAPVTIKAKQTGAGQFGMTATRANGTVYATYGYDNKTGWLTEVDFKDSQGKSAFGYRLQASGHKFAGTTKRWDLVTVATLSGDLAAPPSQPGTYEVPLTATDVYVSASVSCTQGVVNVGTSPFPFATGIAGLEPRGGGAGAQPCPGVSAFNGSAGAPKAPPQGGPTETWGYSVTASPGAVGTYSLLVLVRTLHADPVA